MASNFALPSENSSGDKDGGFQTGKILALSTAHFIHDVYSSFLAPLLPLLIEKLSIISVSVFHVPSPVMVADLSAARKGRGMSFYMTGGELARTVGPLVAVAAVSVFGLEDFYPVMIFGLLSSVWLYFKFRKVPVNQVGPKHRLSILETWRSLRHVLLPLTAILITRGFMHASMTAFLPTYIEMETGNQQCSGVPPEADQQPISYRCVGVADVMDFFSPVLAFSCNQINVQDSEFGIY